MLCLLCIIQVKKSGINRATEYVACLKDIGVKKTSVVRPEHQNYLLKL